MSKFNYESEANRIIHLIKDKFVLPNGALCLERYGDEIFPHHIFPDLGDFLPFFLYYGQEQFIDLQVSLYKKTLKNDVLVSEFPSFGVSKLAKSYEYSDLLFGLYDYNNFKKTDESFKTLLDTSNKAIEIFNFNGNIKSFYHSTLRVNLPLLDTRDGTFIEFYLDLYKLTKDKKYLDISKNIYENLVNSYFYKHNKLLSVFDASYPLRFILNILGVKKQHTVIVCKNISNTLFGFLALYQVEKNPNVLNTINEVLKELVDKMIKDGGVGVSYSKEKGVGISTLTSSFPIIDFLCDMHFEVKESRYLQIAESIASFWINLQGKTGLFPLYSNGNESFFDSETDMCVALLKLHELTKNEKYKLAADLCFEGIIKYHSSKDYVLGVDINTGEVLNITQRTKFIALFLKLLILKSKLDDVEKIYDSKELLSLLKDR